MAPELGVGPRGRPKKRFKKTNAQLNLHTKLLICAAMVVTQSATMLHVTIEGYGRRDWVHETMTVVGLTMCLDLAFSYEAVLIFADTYTRGFIALAIKEQKVIYNISWEDPRVEREEFKLSSDDVVLTISSAGCNVLDYLPGEAEAHHGRRPERGAAGRFGPEARLRRREDAPARLLRALGVPSRVIFIAASWGHAIAALRPATPASSGHAIAAPSPHPYAGARTRASSRSTTGRLYERDYGGTRRGATGTRI